MDLDRLSQETDILENKLGHPMDIIFVIHDEDMPGIQGATQDLVLPPVIGKYHQVIAHPVYHSSLVELSADGG